VGSETATKWYVEQALQAGVGFVNCIPVFIARENYWRKRFEKAGLPIIGDDIKSQVGATIAHRVLARLFADRGVKLERTYQLNVGGNTDFLNMLERDRLESKKISKTNAVTSQLDYDLGTGNVHIGPSDHVPWLTDRKWAYIRLEGRSFGDVPLVAELKLEVWDSPNSAGIVIDAVRLTKLALDHGVAGALEFPSAYLSRRRRPPRRRRRRPPSRPPRRRPSPRPRPRTPRARSSAPAALDRPPRSSGAPGRQVACARGPGLSSQPWISTARGASGKPGSRAAAAGAPRRGRRRTRRR
jgi:myo-inositol-1-phosphate synthase